MAGGIAPIGCLTTMPCTRCFIFFFQAEDGIRDYKVTGVQTCALPISVGVLVPIYLIFRDVGLLDTKVGLLIVYTLVNLPIVCWMLFSFFKEVPREVLEAGRMDGAQPKEELYHLLLPLSLPGIASTSLLAIILSWNEAFWSLNLTAANAAPLTAFIASFSSPEGDRKSTRLNSSHLVISYAVFCLKKKIQ